MSLAQQFLAARAEHKRDKPRNRGKQTVTPTANQPLDVPTSDPLYGVAPIREQRFPAQGVGSANVVRRRLGDRTGMLPEFDAEAEMRDDSWLPEHWRGMEGGGELPPANPAPSLRSPTPAPAWEVASGLEPAEQFERSVPLDRESLARFAGESAALQVQPSFGDGNILDVFRGYGEGAWDAGADTISALGGNEGAQRRMNARGQWFGRAAQNGFGVPDALEGIGAAMTSSGMLDDPSNPNFIPSSQFHRWDVDRADLAMDREAENDPRYLGRAEEFVVEVPRYRGVEGAARFAGSMVDDWLGAGAFERDAEGRRRYATADAMGDLAADRGDVEGATQWDQEAQSAAGAQAFDAGFNALELAPGIGLIDVPISAGRFTGRQVARGLGREVPNVLQAPLPDVPGPLTQEGRRYVGRNLVEPAVGAGAGYALMQTGDGDAEPWAVGLGTAAGALTPGALRLGARAIGDELAAQAAAPPIDRARRMPDYPAGTRLEVRDVPFEEVAPSRQRNFEAAVQDPASLRADRARPVSYGEQVNRDGSVSASDPIDWEAPIESERTSMRDLGIGGNRPIASITDDPNGIPQSFDTTPSVNDPVEMRMARARRMGFDVDNPLYVSSLKDLEAFNPYGKFYGNSGLGGIHLTDSPEAASRYLDRYAELGWVDGVPYQEFRKNVMPVFIRPGNTREVSGRIYDGPQSVQGFPLPEGYEWPRSLDGVDTVIRRDSISSTGDVAHISAEDARLARELSDDPTWHGDPIQNQEYILRDPSRVRSIFAAFDPARSNSSDLLAGLGIGALGGAGVGGALYANDAQASDGGDENGIPLEGLIAGLGVPAALGAAYMATRGGRGARLAERAGRERTSMRDLGIGGNRPIASITDDPNGIPQNFDTTPSVNDPVEMRMARARRMGFDTETPLYHGSERQFDEFDLERSRAGLGFYLARDPAFAADFGEVRPIFTRGDALDLAQYGQWADKADLASIAGELGISASVLEQAWDGVARVRQSDVPMFALLESPEVAPLLRERHTAIDFMDLRNGGADWNRVVTDPSAMRSPDAAFDPARSNSSDLLAGIGIGALGGGGGYALGEMFDGEAQADADGIPSDEMNLIPWLMAGGGAALFGGRQFLRNARSQVGMFAGPNARTANREMLARAEEMAAQGASRDDIWSETGWFQGVDGKWRFEIDDSGAGLTPRASEIYEAENPNRYMHGERLGDVLAHDDLAQAYPDVPEMGAGAYYTHGANSGGSYHPIDDSLGISASSVEDALTGILHETQHGVQRREGFAFGGSPDRGIRRADIERHARQAYEEAGELTDDQLMWELGDQQGPRPPSPENRPAWDDLSRRQQIEWYEAGRQRAYRALAGETEARNVEYRSRFTPEERRSRPPWETQDVPDDQQIIRFDGGVAESRGTSRETASVPLDAGTNQLAEQRLNSAGNRRGVYDNNLRNGDRNAQIVDLREQFGRNAQADGGRGRRAEGSADHIAAVMRGEQPLPDGSFIETPRPEVTRSTVLGVWKRADDAARAAAPPEEAFRGLEEFGISPERARAISAQRNTDPLAIGALALGTGALALGAGEADAQEGQTLFDGRAIEALPEGVDLSQGEWLGGADTVSLADGERVRRRAILGPDGVEYTLIFRQGADTGTEVLGYVRPTEGPPGPAAPRADDPRYSDRITTPETPSDPFAGLPPIPEPETRDIWGGLASYDEGERRIEPGGLLRGALAIGGGLATRGVASRFGARGLGRELATAAGAGGFDLAAGGDPLEAAGYAAGLPLGVNAARSFMREPELLLDPAFRAERDAFAETLSDQAPRVRAMGVAPDPLDHYRYGSIEGVGDNIPADEIISEGWSRDLDAATLGLGDNTGSPREQFLASAPEEQARMMERARRGEWTEGLPDRGQIGFARGDDPSTRRALPPPETPPLSEGMPPMNRRRKRPIEEDTPSNILRRAGTRPAGDTLDQFLDEARQRGFDVGETPKGNRNRARAVSEAVRRYPELREIANRWGLGVLIGVGAASIPDDAGLSAVN